MRRAFVIMQASAAIFLASEKYFSTLFDEGR
jgi:hypothetical protein